MTVTTSISKSGPYAGAGTTGPFTVNFRFLDATHLQVIKTTATGDVTLAYPADYSVAGVGDPTGSVTTVAAVVIGEKLTIIRNVPFTQEADYVQNDDFPAESHEGALDKLTMEVQQLGEVADRSLTLSASVASGVSTELPVPEANKLIGWNPTADALQNIDASTLATTISYGTARADIFSGNGVATSFALSANPGALANLDVIIGGVGQRPGIDYTWTSGTTVTFTTPPVTGTNNILVRYLQALAQGASDSAASTFQQAGAGAVIRIAQNKMRDIVHVADYGAVGDGTTDDTAPIQNALNTGRRVVFGAAKTYLSTGNLIPSNTHLIFERGATIKAANGINKPVLQNVNFQKAGWGVATYGLDTNITIEGMTLDGNQANQAHTGSGVYAGEFTSGIRLGGVTNLVLRDITISQARTFAIWLYAVYNLTAHNIRFDQFMGGTPDNQDGLHINGPAQNLDIRNLRGATNDDMIGLNADDIALGSNFTTGPITNVVVDGVYPDACLNGVRLLSATSRMDQITIRSVKGSTRDVVINASPYGMGPGNIGTLLIQDIDTHCSNPFQPVTSNYYCVIGLDGTIDSLTARDIKVNRPADNRPVFLIPGTGNIWTLDIQGLQIFEANSSTISGVKPVTVIGAINTLRLADVVYARDPALTPTGNLVSINAPGKGVKNFIGQDWVVQRLVIPFQHSDGQLTNLRLTNILDADGLAGFSMVSLASVTVQITNLDIMNCATDFGRQLVVKSGSSNFGARSTIDNAGTSGAMATLPGNQALPLGTYTKLNLTTVIYDRVTGEYSSGAQTFTVTQGPGLYLISAMVDLSTPTNPTDVTLALYKGGSIYRVFPGTPARYTTVANEPGGTMTVFVAQGDVFDVRLFCSANTTANATANTVVSYERLK